MLVNKSNEEFVMRKEVVITDWDGVLQEIEYQWMRPFRDLYDQIYSEFFSDEHLKEITHEDIFSRPEYYLEKWLAKPGVTLTPDQKTLFEYVYMTDTYFYHRCHMLGMFDALVKMAKENFCTEIIILTQTQFGWEGDPRKTHIFEEVIKPLSNKFRLVQIPTDKPKWEYIKENDINFTIFIDDRGDIIRDVAEKVSMKNKVFMMPKMGYNYDLRTDSEFIARLSMFNSSLNVYDQQVLPFTPDTRDRDDEE